MAQCGGSGEQAIAWAALLRAPASDLLSSFSWETPKLKSLWPANAQAVRFRHGRRERHACQRLVCTAAPAAGAAGDGMAAPRGDQSLLARADAFFSAFWKFLRPHTIRGTILGSFAVTARVLIESPVVRQPAIRRTCLTRSCIKALPVALFELHRNGWFLQLLSMPCLKSGRLVLACSRCRSPSVLSLKVRMQYCTHKNVGEACLFSICMQNCKRVWLLAKAVGLGAGHAGAAVRAWGFEHQLEKPVKGTACTCVETTKRNTARPCVNKAGAGLGAAAACSAGCAGAAVRQGMLSINRGAFQGHCMLM